MPPLDLEHLLKLRLVVARHGEMDVARFWNSTGLLGRYGKSALGRGFPRTHFFAQARAVFAVAQSRADEVFELPGAVTLWRLPAVVEERFEVAWQEWLDEAERFTPVFEALAEIGGNDGGGEDLLESMQKLELLAPSQAEAVRTLEVSADGRAVEVSGARTLDDELVTLLAAGFSRGEPGCPAVPFARLEKER